MSAAAAAMILGVVLIVLALVYFLVSTIFQLRKIVAGLDRVIEHVGGIVEKSAPVDDDRRRHQREPRRRRLRARGAAGQEGGHERRRRPHRGPLPGRRRRRACATSRRARTSWRRGSARSTRAGTLTLARLGREAPIAAASPRGPALRDPAYGSAASRALYPEGREPGAAELPRSPVIGTDSPEQYERREDIGQPRKRFPAKQS